MKKIVCVIIICLVGLFGCMPHGAYVKADRATYDAVAPEYREYVEEDDTLTKEQKERRYTTVETWKERVGEGSK